MIQDYVRRPTARSRQPSRPGHAHPTGTGGSHPDRARPLQRRDRRRVVPKRTDHQDTRDPHPGQAAAPEHRGPGRGSRLRKRTHPAGNSLTRRLRSRGPCAIIRPYPAGEYSDRTADPSPARLPPSSSNGPTEQTRAFCALLDWGIARLRSGRSRQGAGVNLYLAPECRRRLPVRRADGNAKVPQLTCNASSDYPHRPARAEPTCLLRSRPRTGPDRGGPVLPSRPANTPAGTRGR